MLAIEGEETPVNVLLVDDDPLLHLIVSETLEGPGYRLECATCAEQALQWLLQREFDVILTDRVMPGMHGDEFCRRVRGQLGLTMQPILMLTGATGIEALSDSLACGADDVVRKPFHPVELRARVRVAAQRKRSTDQLDSTESTLFALARMVEAKDENTGDHCSRLAHASVQLGRALGLPPAELLALRRGGVLHDIGKLGIPDAILLKPGPLTDAEWKTMRQHTTIGYQLVAQLRSLRLTAPVILHHHERWDGSGYPHGLAGQDIPLLARVFQVVDIFDALTYERPYKPAFSFDAACEMLEQEVRQGWRDPDITACFLDLVRRRPQLLSAPPLGSEGGLHDLGVDLFNAIATPH